MYHLKWPALPDKTTWKWMASINWWQLCHKQWWTRKLFSGKTIWKIITGRNFRPPFLIFNCPMLSHACVAVFPPCWGEYGLASGEKKRISSQTNQEPHLQAMYEARAVAKPAFEDHVTCVWQLMMLWCNSDVNSRSFRVNSIQVKTFKNLHLCVRIFKFNENTLSW